MEPTNSIPEVQTTTTAAQGESSPSPERSSGLAYVFVFIGILIPALWVVLTLPSILPVQALQRTRQQLKEDVAAVQLFFSKYKKNPENLNVLRAFAYSYSLPFDAYDPFGERIDYLRLDDRHFLLRSFGADQFQNTLTSPLDLAIVSWGERANEPLTYNYPQLPVPSFYPAALLSGADSPNHQWLARLYGDPVSSTRRLVIRHLKRDGLFMVAPHDGVEEFFWLPTGDRIIYTATGSSRYRDGVYLWNLQTDTSVNLLEKVRTTALKALNQEADTYWLALAGLSSRGPVVYFYLQPRHAGGLSPVEFFQRKNMVAIAVPEKGRPRLATYEEFPASDEVSVVGHPYAVRAHLQGQGIAIQRQWLQLPTAQELERLLVAWHDISEQAIGTPLYPYSLWLLSTFYGESAASPLAGSTKEQEVLRSYGTEVARALLNYPLAPSYLKGLALFNYEELMGGRVLPYRFARFNSKLASPDGDRDNGN